MRAFVSVFVLLCFLCHPIKSVRAQTPEALHPEVLQLLHAMQASMSELKSTVEAQNEMIRRQALRIQALESGGSKPAAVTPSGPVKTADLSHGFNPEIGVVGTVQANLTENTEDEEGKDTIALKELEIRFAQSLDLHSRVDAILAFNDNLEAQNVDIEEAYYSRWGLPWDFAGRVGKFRANAGKQNLLHLHQLATVDYPLVIQDFFGEEGMSASGVRLQNHIPNPWDTPLTLTGEVFRGNEGASFSGISRRPIFNTHAEAFVELADHVHLELGSTWMVGDENAAMLSKGDDRFGTHLFGFDKTLNLRMEGGREVKWQSEVYFQRRSSLVTENDDPWGFYSLLDYRLSPHWSTGVRLDYLEPREAADGRGRSTAISPYLTFWQSEFANFRIQYQHLEPADPAQKSDDAVYLQANFLMGTHRHDSCRFCGHGHTENGNH